jgi:uncharacterized circularly permuted ATP-grasp superfamily protein/uncharacterized alpha-E superfamily protein
MQHDSLLMRYAPSAARYDEMLDDIQIPRPHWRVFLTQLASMSKRAMQERSRFVHDSIASDGVTYNIYADPRGKSRQWELDLLPLILPQEEFSQIALAVSQRARLLNAILGDLYGERTLLSEGLIPPALVFGQRAYLWPALGALASGSTRLFSYAVDLARSPDGRFWVLADRTRGPSGAGYALQNRTTLWRAFPDAFQKLDVEPLEPFFDALEDGMHQLAPTRGRSAGETPLVVLLTPGPYNETYFEHVLTARTLGFPLVEGQDLLVRGDAVYLKTLRGLRRVHGILRRLDDDFCDPLELRADSALGIPGLLSAIRAGNVFVGNALGSGVLETNALGGFYPALCEHLLGEKLRMPQIATWWCGEEPALEYVISHLDELVIKPTYPTIRMEPIFGHTLDAAARAELVTKMRAQPHAYVAQEWVRLSHAPVWGKEAQGLLPRATTFRVFAVAAPDSPSGYMVMPGALTRVSPHAGDVVSMQWGGSSKDTWVLGDKPVARAPLARPKLRASDVRTRGVDVPSRVGENLFWTGRYAERCESSARLLRAGIVRLMESSSSAGLLSITEAAKRLGVLPRPKLTAKGEARDGLKKARVKEEPPRADAFLRAVADASVSGGLAANLGRLHGCASQVREHMSTDNWHLLSELPTKVPRKDASLGVALQALDEIMISCVSLAGFAFDDMTRDQSWQFLRMGRRIERLAVLSGLSAYVMAEEDGASLEWLLESANSIVTFRARYRRLPELLPVVHLVVMDTQNPHAVAFQLREIEDTLSELLAPEESFAGIRKLGKELSDFPLDALADDGVAVGHACAKLADLLGRVERASYVLSDDLSRRFFSHAASAAPVEAP